MLQGGEIVIILLLALVVLGPKRLPEIARKMGRWSAELRRAASDLRAGLEAEVGDLSEVREEFQRPVKEMRDELADVGKQLDESTGDVRRLKWVGPEPKSGPSPADALSDLDEIEGDVPSGESVDPPAPEPESDQNPDA